MDRADLSSFIGAQASANEAKAITLEADAGAPLVLIVSPHFDDEVIGCGGAILYHRDVGDRVAVAFVTRGDCGDLRQGLGREECSRVRRAEAARVCAELGASVVHLGHEEGFVRHTPDLERQLVQLVRRLRPIVVYCPHADERHPDHQSVCASTRAACIKASQAVFPHLGSPKHNLEELRYYEVWTPMHAYDVVLDITPYAERKREVIKMYESQMRSVNYADAALGLNRYRGLMTTGAAYAEVFRSERIRPLRLSPRPTVRDALDLASDAPAVSSPNRSDPLCA
jgi:LmbE family N-acetylglucosaminyl deacetylase